VRAEPGKHAQSRCLRGIRSDLVKRTVHLWARTDSRGPLVGRCENPGCGRGETRRLLQ
jgi:hypothetical protein